MSLFPNSKYFPSTPFSNNNNIRNLPNRNNQTGIFSAPPNLPNNSFGNLPPQPSFGSMSGGGGLLGNPQPSGGLFGNQIQQQPQGGGSLFGGQVQQQAPTGGLFGGPQPSGGLFGNQTQQQLQGGGLLSNQIQQQQPPSGGLFGSQVQQQPQSGSLFGGQTQQQAQGGGGRFGNLSGAINFSSTGTVGLIGRHHINNYPKNKENISLPSITNRNEFRGNTLDEIRTKDYFNLKNNTLDSAQKSSVSTVISMNLNRIGTSTVHSHFSSTGLPPNLATLFSDPTVHSQPLGNGKPPLGISKHPSTKPTGLFMSSQPSQITPPPQNTQPTTLFGVNNTQAAPASGSLFMNPQSSQIIPPLARNIPTNQPSNLQSSSLTTQTFSQPETKSSVIKTVKPTAAKSEKKTIISNPGSFNYEFNKMLFVSGLIQIMEKHNMKMPENLLDDTDFAPQLLAFLEQHNISLPTENIPQFQISSVAPLESENNFGELNNDEEYNNYC